MKFKKVKPYDRRLISQYWSVIAVVSTLIAFVLLFYDIPEDCKKVTGLSSVLLIVIICIYFWISANNLTKIEVNIDGSNVRIMIGDLFEQEGLKVIAFNEYFDTHVDDVVIAKNSLNGLYINKFYGNDFKKLDNLISGYQFDRNYLCEINDDRKFGKKQKYKLGTICKIDDYILTAFAKFNDYNEARLTMPEYLGFLIQFWDEINRVYAQKTVSVPIFGSGITRIKEHKNISDEDLLKIMLWTFKISETRFKYPANLNIIVHKDKLNKVNFYEVSRSWAS